MNFTYLVDNLAFELISLRRILDEDNSPNLMSITILVTPAANPDTRLGELSATNYENVHKFEIGSKVVYSESFPYDWEIHVVEVLDFFQDLLLPPDLTTQKLSNSSIDSQAPGVVLPAAGGWDVL